MEPPPTDAQTELSPTPSKSLIAQETTIHDQITPLTRLLPPQTLSTASRRIIFEHLYRRLAAHYDGVILRGEMEVMTKGVGIQWNEEREKGSVGKVYDRTKEENERKFELFKKEMNMWAVEMVKCLWGGCGLEGEPPTFDPYADTSTRNIPPIPIPIPLPNLKNNASKAGEGSTSTRTSTTDSDQWTQILTATLFLHLTTPASSSSFTSNDITQMDQLQFRFQYSSHTRTFLSAIGLLPAQEHLLSQTLHNPSHALSQVHSHPNEKNHPSSILNLRNLTIGGAALAGGLVTGITGGLGAPLVGAGVSSLLGWLGASGALAGAASGLAGSGAVCGALFGMYGARKTGEAVGRRVRDVKDWKVVRVRDEVVLKHGEARGNDEDEKKAMAVRIGVSGWIGESDDVWEPWTIFDDSVETFALQWEVEALQQLSNALTDLVKTQALKYIKKEIIKRTVLAALFSSLAPLQWLKLTQIVDNPWSNAMSLAHKTGIILGELLASRRTFGSRPIILTGYSLGSVVILSALSYLASLPPSSDTNPNQIVQDVFLFGTPVASNHPIWTSARRVVSGRLVNGYCEGDYILAVLARVSDIGTGMSTIMQKRQVDFGVAGLGPVGVRGVENVRCEGVEGHLAWRGMIGRCLEQVGAEGLVTREVKMQARDVGERINREMMDWATKKA